MATVAPATSTVATHSLALRCGRLAASGLPLVVFLTAFLLHGGVWPAWVVMWSLAFSIYASLKLLTWLDAGESAGHSWRRSLGYLLLWPGMDARAFFHGRRTVARPSLREWLFAALKLAAGCALIWGAVPLASAVFPSSGSAPGGFEGGWQPLALGWLGMTGLVMTLHFGLFHLLSLSWRAAGVDARPIMQSPLLSASLTEFWGRRWNLAFRDLAHAYVFRPLAASAGSVAAMLAVFFVSGIVHDAVITLPAGGGWGGPTLYFLLQGTGVLMERSRGGRRIGLGRGTAGRVFAAAVLVLPLPLLFPAVFVERIALPTLAFLGVVS